MPTHVPVTPARHVRTCECSSSTMENGNREIAGASMTPACLLVQWETLSGENKVESDRADHLATFSDLPPCIKTCMPRPQINTSKKYQPIWMISIINAFTQLFLMALNTYICTYIIHTFIQMGNLVLKLFCCNFIN